MLYAMAAKASCILNCVYLQSSMDSSSVAGALSEKAGVFVRSLLYLPKTGTLLSVKLTTVASPNWHHPPARLGCAYHSYQDYLKTLAKKANFKYSEDF